ncbi:hypothetical protein [Sessilibacter corallicola]|uniref:hypothetical protein n=1 Tax=Sessilibacter corallicola TaxID=2904075 RepID=UPI001E570754|nr:hypothetical protein [Sessilibacter corallicola]MCE2028978.1 hypothetical protein [Sessilibacter corallicola]
MYKNNFAKLLVLSTIEFKRVHGANAFALIWFLLRPLLFVSAIYMVVNMGVRGGDVKAISTYDYLRMLGAYSIWLLISETVSGSINRMKKSKVWMVNHSVPPLLIVFIPLGLVFVNYTVMYWGSVIGLITIDRASVQYLPIFISTFFVGIVHAWFYGVLTLMLTAIFKPASNVIPTFLQFGFWFTPIIWVPNSSHLSELIADFNPIYLLVSVFDNSSMVSNALYVEVFLLVFISLISSAVLYFCTKDLAENSLEIT